MPDVSLITSLYKTEKFLPQYIELATELAREVKAAGINLEFVIIPNDATDNERQLLTAFDKTLVAENIATLQIHYVGRETLYASWNRGLSFAGSDVFGFWNVDDKRTANGVIEGQRLLNNGADLVDFALTIQKNGRMIKQSAQYYAGSFAPKSGVGPFFMFHRRLLEKAGVFNPHFRITGDFEWCKREAVRQSNVETSDISAGVFILHDSNLSGGTSTEWIEFNLALLIHGQTQFLRPVDPLLMRQYQDGWGHQFIDLDGDTANWLWGEGAQERFERFERERNLPGFARRIMLALAKRGLIRSVDWELHHGQ